MVSNLGERLGTGQRGQGGSGEHAFLLKTELVGRAYEAFQAVGLRPPPRLQPLTS